MPCRPWEKLAISALSISPCRSFHAVDYTSDHCSRPPAVDGDKADTAPAIAFLIPDIMTVVIPDLNHRSSSNAAVIEQGAGGWRLSLPPGPGNRYRLAQLDDYTSLARRKFRWMPPVQLRLRARTSAPDIPGTWGFGLWNDPFNFSIGLGGATRVFPALPNAVWFFAASPPNSLSIYDDLPADGLLAATFRSAALPAALLALAAPVLPLFALPPAARALRRLARRFIRQDAHQLCRESGTSTAQSTQGSGWATQWHTYSLEWRADRAIFHLDHVKAFETEISPFGPLGIVIWVDNQYAALPPNGKLRYGTLPSPDPVWLEIDDLRIE